VDDDLAQCPLADFSGSTGISDAITAATAGDTIVVCPGTYDPTTVVKRVTLSGYTADLSSKLSVCSDRLNFPADQTTKNSIVDGGFTLSADCVTIKNKTTKGNFSDDIHIGDLNNDDSIKNNDFRNGGSNFDCQDESSGAGTAGTANTWTKNKGNTSDPVGICK
jgi:hypothetical protein